MWTTKRAAVFEWKRCAGWPLDAGSSRVREGERGLSPLGRQGRPGRRPRLMAYRQANPDLSAVRRDSTVVHAHASVAGALKLKSRSYPGRLPHQVHFLTDHRIAPYAARDERPPGSGLGSSAAVLNKKYQRSLARRTSCGPSFAQRNERAGIERESELGPNAHVQERFSRQRGYCRPGCFGDRQAYTVYWYIIEHPHSTAALSERRSP